MNKENYTNRKRGFITKIIILIVALVAIKYTLHFDIVEYVHSPQVQAYLHTAQEWAQNVYHTVDTTVNRFIK